MTKLNINKYFDKAERFLVKRYKPPKEDGIKAFFYHEIIITALMFQLEEKIK